MAITRIELVRQYNRQLRRHWQGLLGNQSKLSPKLTKEQSGLYKVDLLFMGAFAPDHFKLKPGVKLEPPVLTDKPGAFIAFSREAGNIKTVGFHLCHFPRGEHGWNIYTFRLYIDGIMAGANEDAKGYARALPWLDQDMKLLEVVGKKNGSSAITADFRRAREELIKEVLRKLDFVELR